MEDYDLKKLKPITVGEILFSHRQLGTIFKNELKKKPENFSSLPVKVIVKRRSNGKVIDMLGIERIELNQEKPCIWIVCITNKTSSIFTHDGTIYKLNLKTISTDDVSKGFKKFEKIYRDDKNKRLKEFLDLPVQIIVTDEKGEEVIDCLDIVASLMNDVGSGIFYHCFIDDLRMISENPNIEKLLDDSERKYSDLMAKLIKARH